MTESPDPGDVNGLRQRAEEALRKSARDIEELPVKDLQTLVQELQVHQIELKMQNQELRETQLQLEGSRDSYTELYEFAPVGYLTLDNRGVIQTANLTASTLFGLHRTDLIDTKIARHVAAEDQDGLHQAFLHLRESKKKQTKCELRILNQGQPSWTQLKASVRQTNPDECLVTLSDISLHKRAEAELTQLNQTLEQRVAERSEELSNESDALRLSEERLSLAFRASKDAIWDCDLKAGTLWWNDSYENLFGKRPGTANSPHWWIEYIHPDDRTRVANTVKAAEGSGSDYGDYWEEEYRFQRQEGSLTHVVDRAFISRNAEGQATRMIGTIQDITARVASEEKRLQDERLAAIGEAMAGLVHESRNALNRTVSALRMIERRTKDKPEIDEFIDGAREALQDIQGVFEEVRQYAAPVKLNLQPCRLVELADKSWKRLLLVRKKRKARIIRCGETNPECNACEATLSQVFRNIFENALAACDDPVEIELRYSHTELHGKPAICIAVSDNGPGLTEEVHARVFDAFYTTRTHGTGLGMAICKRIVEAHGGTIEAGNPNGSGAEFTITLPIDK